MSILTQKLDLTGAPAGTYTGYLEVDGDIGSIGPNGLGLTVFKPITYDSSGNLKAADGTSDYVIAAAVGGSLGHIARASLTILFNGAPVGGVLQFDLIESSAGIVDIKALYLQGKVQPVTPGVLANLTDLLAQATALVPQMQQSLDATVLSESQRNANVAAAISSVAAAGTQAVSGAAAAGAQAVSDAGTAAAAALVAAGRTFYTTDALRAAATPPDNTKAFVLATGAFWTRTAGAWVLEGNGVPLTSAVPGNAFDLAALAAYQGAATILAVQTGPGRGVWVRDDTRTANGVTVYSGVSPRKWVRFDARMKAEQAVNQRSTTYLASNNLAQDASTVDAADVNVVANQTEWSAFMAAWFTGHLDVGGRGNSAMKANISKSATVPVTDAVISGAGTVLQMTQGLNNMWTFFSANNLLLENLHMIGVGTDYKDATDGNFAPRTGGRAIATSGGFHFTIRNAYFEKFGQAAVYHTNIASTRTLDSTFIGVDEYDATNNQRGVKNGLITGDTASGNYHFGIHLIISILYPDHWVHSNLFTKLAMGLQVAPDLKRLKITYNTFTKIRGQHAVYLSGTEQLFYGGNATNDYVYDGLKNQISSGDTADSVANIYWGNSFMAGRGSSWSLNQSRVSGSFRHIASLMGGNVTAQTNSGGWTMRATDHGMLTTSVVVDVGTYGVYVLDMNGAINNHILKGAAWTPLYAGVSTGGRLQISDTAIIDGGANPVNAGSAAQPGIGGATLTNPQKSLMALSGGGTINVRTTRSSGSVGGAVASIYNEDTATTLEIERSVYAPSSLPVIIAGTLSKIDGPNIGTIYTSLSTLTAFDWSGGTIREGRGRGREFNTASIPTAGSYRAADAFINNVPVGTWAWVQTSLSGGPMHTVPLVRVMNQTVTWDPASIAAGASATPLNVSVPNAALSDFVDVFAEGGWNAGLFLTGQVTAAGTVTLNLTNASSAAIDPPNRVIHLRLSPAS
ncbi:hypothetical protein [Deinococcus alpinitundrae]|uniref:hypothetical protein n=1 Tax=Deinococcus alpinitundrae TaxID=468913 RepID=UPI00137B093E|nr:hypothetical protein [Deinococcus alpinitundrae]